MNGHVRQTDITQYENKNTPTGGDFHIKFRFLRAGLKALIVITIAIASLPVIMDSSIVQRHLSQWISTSLIQGVSPEKIHLTLFPTPEILFDGINVEHPPFEGCRIDHVRIELSPLSLLADENKITGIYLDGVTLPRHFFAPPVPTPLSHSPAHLPDSNSKYATEGHRETVMGQVNDLLTQLEGYVDAKTFTADITNMRSPWFDRGDLHLNINRSKRSLEGTITVNAPKIENIPIHKNITVHGLSADQLTGSFSFALTETKTETQTIFPRASSPKNQSPMLTGEMALILSKPMVHYTQTTLGGEPSEASTHLGIDTLQSTLSLGGPLTEDFHLSDLNPFNIEITCLGNSTWSASYDFNGDTPSLIFSGKQLDVEPYGFIFKNILPTNPICNTLFNILRDGSVDEVTVQFSASDHSMPTATDVPPKRDNRPPNGAVPPSQSNEATPQSTLIQRSMADLFDPEAMTIEGRLHDGVVAIPGTDLVASNLTGRAVVEQGILKIIVESAMVEKAQINVGGISVGLIDQRHPYEGNFDISTDLSPLHEILKGVITHHGIAEALKRIDAIHGKLHGILAIQGDRNGTPRVDVNADADNLKLMDPRLPKALTVRRGTIRYLNGDADPMDLKKTHKTESLPPAPAIREHDVPSALPAPIFHHSGKESPAIQTIDLKGISGALGQSTVTDLNGTMTVNLTQDKPLWGAPLTFTADQAHLELKEILPWLSRFFYSTSANAKTDKNTHFRTSLLQQLLNHTQGMATFEAPHFYGLPTKKGTWRYHLAGRVMDAAISLPHDGTAPTFHEKRPKAAIKKEPDQWIQGQPHEPISNISFDFSLVRSDQNQELRINNTDARIDGIDLIHDWLPYGFIKDLKVPVTLSEGRYGLSQTGNTFQGALDFETGLRLGIRGEDVHYTVDGNLMGKLYMDIGDFESSPWRDHKSNNMLHLTESDPRLSKKTVAKMIYDSALLPNHFPLTLQGTLESNGLNSLFQKDSQTMEAIDHLLQGKRFAISSSQALNVTSVNRSKKSSSVKPPSPTPLSMNREGENTLKRRHAQAFSPILSDYTIHTDTLTLDYILHLIERIKAFTVKESRRPSFPIPSFTLETNSFILNSMHFSPFRAHINLNDTPMANKEMAKTIMIDTMVACSLHPVTEIRITPEKLDISLRINDEKQNIEPLISCFYNGKRLMEGTYTMETSLTTSLPIQANLKTMASKAVSALLNENLNGTIHITSEKGRIFRLTLLSRILSMINVGELMAGNLPDIEQNGFAYDTIEIDGTVESGRITLQKAVINGLDMTLIFMGWIDPFHETMALTCLVAPFKTADSIIKNIPILGKMFNNRLISIPVKAWGPIHDPELMILHPSDVGHGLIKTMENILKAPFELIKSLPQAGPSRSKSSHSESK